MRLHEATVASFARHETFHPRYGWFRKAFDHTSKDPSVFLADDAPVRLGVGKNMVKSIRFWGLAAKVTCEQPHQSLPRRNISVPTEFGNAVFGAKGLDPFLEDVSTLWLLHWMMHAPLSTMPVSWAAFNVHSAVEFEPEEMSQNVEAEIARTSVWKQPKLSSIHRDLAVMYRMYGPLSDAGRGGLDSVLDSPFRELGLLRRSAVSGSGYRFTLGSKPTLPDEIITAAVLDYVMATRDPNVRTVLVSRVANDPGSPGRLFKLTENDMGKALSRIAANHDQLTLAAPTGVTQLGWSADPDNIAQDLLERLYQIRPDGLLIGPQARAPHSSMVNT